MKRPTTTHFAVLGLLALRPWATYELIQYLRGSNIRYIWSKTQARLYETPKELVAFGFATADKQRISSNPDAKGRERTVYSITDPGRTALREWLDAPSQPPSFEIEPLLKLAFADQGTLASFLGQIDEIQNGIVAAADFTGLESASQSPQLPARHHLSAHMADLSDRIIWTVLTWLEELKREAQQWDTIEATPERVEEAKAHYAAILKRAKDRRYGS